MDDVVLESRPTESGFAEFRARVEVCTGLDGLQRFVADPDRFDEWIPFTEEARALPDDEGGERYYLRTATPWPLRSRDMIYELHRSSDAADGALRIELDGVPDALPPSDDAVRMDGARGMWTLRPGRDRIDVELQLTIDPGSVPRFLANRRTGTTVGTMLQNLHQRFPCGPAPTP